MTSTPSDPVGSDLLQRDVIAFLSDAAAYGEAGDAVERMETSDAVERMDTTDAVERIETHVSIVFLWAERAYKLKRAVAFPYLDFSTLEKRRAACAAELLINRRTAPQLYLRVVAVTRQKDGTLALDGTGEPVEWLVEMVRFGQDGMFDRLAEGGKLDRHTMEDLADAIADFHKAAEPRTDRGGASAMQGVIENNEACFNDHAGVFDGEKLAALTSAYGRVMERTSGLLDERRDAGKVRWCHGDLHLRNIVRVDGRPVLFDGIEFNDLFAIIDVLYDLAFLIMDLDHRGERRLANVTLNRYLDVTGDGGGLGALALFLSMRAAVRAHVGAAAGAANLAAAGAANLAAAGVGVEDAAVKGDQVAEARAYLDRALEYLAPTSPRLVAVGGLSGSGKSRMGRELAPLFGAAPGARVVRSDTLRKRLMGVTPTTRLRPDGYTPEMTEQTYAALYDEARAALSCGHSVVADAVFSKPHERTAIEAVAVELGVPFEGLWLEAPADVMAERIDKRQRNASDATLDVLHSQLTYDLGDIGWHRISSAGTKDQTLLAGCNVLKI